MIGEVQHCIDVSGTDGERADSLLQSSFLPNSLSEGRERQCCDVDSWWLPWLWRYVECFCPYWLGSAGRGASWGDKVDIVFLPVDGGVVVV